MMIACGRGEAQEINSMMSDTQGWLSTDKFTSDVSILMDESGSYRYNACQ